VVGAGFGAGGATGASGLVMIRAVVIVGSGMRGRVVPEIALVIAKCAAKASTSFSFLIFPKPEIFPFAIFRKASTVFPARSSFFMTLSLQKLFYVMYVDPVASPEFS